MKRLAAGLLVPFGAAVVLSAFSVATTAQEIAQAEARLLSASPDSPTSSLAWRGGLRGTVGVRIALVGDSSSRGFQLYLPALIELHNDGTGASVPYEYWRGRLSLEPTYRFVFKRPRPSLAWAISLPIEHESDHPTSGNGFLNLNSLAARNDLTVPLGRNFLTATNVLRLHFLTCTSDVVVCGNQGGRGGSVAFETAVELVFDGILTPRTPWRYFASVVGSWLVQHQLAHEERRLVFNTGFWVRTARRGMFQFFGTLLVGNDVGYFRATSEGVQGGGGIRWGL